MDEAYVYDYDERRLISTYKHGHQFIIDLD